MECAPPTFFAAYGSLRRRSLARQGHSVAKSLQFYGYGLLRGLGFIQHRYSGVIEQPGIVVVEIYGVLDKVVWEALDRYEGYNPILGTRAHFYRKQVKLLRPDICASVYFLGREIPRGTHWQEYMDAASRRAGRSKRLKPTSGGRQRTPGFRRCRNLGFPPRVNAFQAP
jgi:gamma-glutamylcyclotransferase (GGCT)/AIG2-like uncharacterized protein YtfP